MSHVTTHILDAASGMPAPGVRVVLAMASDDLLAPAGEVIAEGVTDADGRLGLGPDTLAPGAYALTFATGDYFASRAITAFYPRVNIMFNVENGRVHTHVPLLLSPFAYSTYRGS